MKKTITLISILMILLGLTACGSGAANTDPGTAQAVDSLLPTDYENAMPATTQLVVGTLKLDGTANEVDINQAAELLTLWQAAKSLSSSDSTAPEELNALFKQIEETMTPEQIQAIKDMKLTREDMSQVFQQMGMNFGAGEGRFANMTPEQLATAEAARQSGQGFPRGDFSGGGPPPGDFAGGFPGGGGGQGFRGGQASGSNGQSGNSANGNSSSNGQTNLNASRFGSAFYDVVIQYLQEKVNPGSSDQPGNQSTSQPGNQ